MTVCDTPWPEGTPCWVDVMVPDTKRAAEFYGPLLGWELADQGAEFGGYLIAQVDGRAAAAVGPKPPGMEQMPSVWTTYLATDNADATAAKITQGGGQLIMEPGDVGAAGRLAVATDPTGAAFGIWQAGKTTGVEIANVPGTLVWNECMTRDLEAAKAFYSSVFGYEYDDISSAGFAYVIAKVNGNIIGGMGGLPAEVPAEVPAHWSTYFGVTDTDATVAKAGELGGSVLRAPQDSPYGRSAQVADDQGVPFNVISVEG
ncbi:VOC family protein [Amycolatopsis acidiphila]|uniref:VOC family protein n=1 Tax=Amycolatopsis acidiphila TaxID=715473 RepID=A0A557ZYA9_9PSEU|nr:VOC family protein [Amycolatopsis acidiphila]TVT16996.1 VOC family protein [Amycolatopsis acidiphila]UIJ60861.1 VOC family protein [Amycolatopsis acidiphila]GHG94893.1 glyoxalase [Amycolatopsis acidiphila]